MKSKQKVQKYLNERIERRKKKGLPIYQHDKVTFKNWLDDETGKYSKHESYNQNKHLQ